ncbi:ECF transporter S component [Clostridium botulinum]
MEKNFSMEKKEKTRKIAVFAMFSAISVILGFTPLGIIPIPPVAATIIHVPVIITAILEGPVLGV